jgi:peptidoglycan/xylan/chitin deacetylase (PgdA/CDA1 family)
MRQKSNEMRITRKYTSAAHRILIDQIYHRALGHRRPIIRRQPAGVNTVALTFDDGPSPASTPHLLRELERAGGRATFFLTGVRVAAHRSLAAEIVAAGHDVYGHGWEHVNLEHAGADAAVAAAERVEAWLAALRPTPTPYLIRFPYNAGYQRGWMHRAMQRFHPDIHFASWSFSTRDWLLAEGSDDMRAVTRRCEAVADEVGSLADLPGTIVLLHEDPFGAAGHLSASVARILLPEILERIAARGLQLDVIRADGARPASRAACESRGLS